MFINIISYNMDIYCPYEKLFSLSMYSGKISAEKNFFKTAPFCLFPFQTKKSLSLYITGNKLFFLAYYYIFTDPSTPEQTK